MKYRQYTMEKTGRKKSVNYLYEPQIKNHRHNHQRPPLPTKKTKMMPLLEQFNIKKPHFKILNQMFKYIENSLDSADQLVEYINNENGIYALKSYQIDRKKLFQYISKLKIKKINVDHFKEQILKKKNQQQNNYHHYQQRTERSKTCNSPKDTSSEEQYSRDQILEKLNYLMNHIPNSHQKKENNHQERYQKNKQQNVLIEIDSLKNKLDRLEKQYIQKHGLKYDDKKQFISTQYNPLTTFGNPQQKTTIGEEQTVQITKDIPKQINQKIYQDHEPIKIQQTSQKSSSDKKNQISQDINKLSEKLQEKNIQIINLKKSNQQIIKKNEKKDHKIETLENNYNNIKIQNNNLNNQIADLLHERQKSQQNVNSLTLQNEFIQKEYKEIVKLNENIRQNSKKQQNYVAQIEEKYSNTMDQLKEKESQFENLKEELKQKLQRILQLEDQIKNKNNQINQNLSQSKVKELEKRTLQNEKRFFQEQSKILEQKIIEAAESKQKAQDQLKNLNQQYRISRQQNEKLHIHIESLTMETQQLKQNMEFISQWKQNRKDEDQMHKDRIIIELEDNLAEYQRKYVSISKLTENSDHLKLINIFNEVIEQKNRIIAYLKQLIDNTHIQAQQIPFTSRKVIEFQQKCKNIENVKQMLNQIRLQNQSSDKYLNSNPKFSRLSKFSRQLQDLRSEAINLKQQLKEKGKYEENQHSVKTSSKKNEFCNKCVHCKSLQEIYHRENNSQYQNNDQSIRNEEQQEGKLNVSAEKPQTEIDKLLIMEQQLNNIISNLQNKENSTQNLEDDINETIAKQKSKDYNVYIIDHNSIPEKLKLIEQVNQTKDNQREIINISENARIDFEDNKQSIEEIQYSLSHIENNQNIDQCTTFMVNVKNQKYQIVDKNVFKTVKNIIQMVLTNQNEKQNEASKDMVVFNLQKEEIIQKSSSGLSQQVNYPSSPSFDRNEVMQFPQFQMQVKSIHQEIVQSQNYQNIPSNIAEFNFNQNNNHSQPQQKKDNEITVNQNEVQRVGTYHSMNQCIKQQKQQYLKIPQYNEELKAESVWISGVSKSIQVNPKSEKDQKQIIEGLEFINQDELEQQINNNCDFYINKQNSKTNQVNIVQKKSLPLIPDEKETKIYRKGSFDISKSANQ